MGKLIKLKNDIFIANEIYSTTEKIIGKWVNGETLYRKCLIFNDAFSANTLFTKAHGISNAKTIMIRYAGFYHPDGGLSYPLNITGYSSNLTDRGYCYADRTNIYIYGNGGWGYAWYKIIILEYTKN